MTTIYETPQVRFVLHKQHRALEEAFLPSEQSIYGDAFREITQKLIQLCQEHRIEQLLINNQSGAFSINPELQKWMQETVYPELYEHGVRRKAYLLGADIYSRMSVKRTAESDKNQLFEYDYFKDRDEALEWLAGAPA